MNIYLNQYLNLKTKKGNQMVAYNDPSEIRTHVKTFGGSYSIQLNYRVVCTNLVKVLRIT